MLDCFDTAVQPLFIGPHEMPRWIERVRPHVERMADGSGGRFEAQDIIAALLAGRFHLWVMMEGPELLCAMVTEVIEYPRIRALRAIGLVGHRSRKWLHLVPAIEHAAKACFGATLVEALVRDGHERLFLHTGGWARFHTLWEKSL